MIPTVLRSSELRILGLSPKEFLSLTTSNQQLVAAAIVGARGDRRTAQLLQSHNPNLTQFVVESDNVQ